MSKRLNKGAWAAGQSGNPNGRPRNALTLDELATAVRAVEKKKKQTLIKHFVERAYVNDTLLLGLFKKFIPDLASFNAFIGACEDRLNVETAKNIRKKLRERFKSCQR
jgi:Family of unknown function (DUF5681)